MIKNAKTEPKVYYGLHFVEGVAEYRVPGKEPKRILVDEQTMKNMDPSYSGKPVYVDHVQQVDLEHIQEEADGYVIESFFNKSDGRHWAKFIAVSDKAHEAIAHGWKLSNAYTPTEKAPGGLWHGVDYDEEIKAAIYDHLAIVKNPRYGESVILTPEQFKEYNEKKEKELERLTNELEGDYSMLNFFKRTKVENSADLENTVVLLPKSKKEFTISDLVKNADLAEEKKKEPQMANGEDMVKVGEDTMSVNELIDKHMKMCDAMKKNEDDENLKEEAEKQVKKNDEADGDSDEKKKNEEEKKEEVKKNAADEQAKKKERFESLKNAHNTVQKEVPTIECSMDQLVRGKKRYGSG